MLLFRELVEQLRGRSGPCIMCQVTHLAEEAIGKKRKENSSCKIQTEKKKKEKINNDKSNG